MTYKGYSSKKGNVGDIAIWIVVVVVLIIAIPFGFRIWSAVNDEIQSNDSFNADTKAVTQNMTDKLPGYWDGGFLLLVFMIYIAILISVWFIDIHPAFIALTILSAILLIVVGGIFNNITEQMIKSEGLATASTHFPILVFFAERFALINFFLIMGVMIAIFAKWKSRQE